MRTLLAVLATGLLCQCKTERTVTKKRSSISFDQSLWGTQGNTDEKAIRNKFANKGFTVNEQGQIVADRSDLYTDSKAKGYDGAFGKKEAKFKNDTARTKQFRTPEYIKRQQFAGVDSARESGARAREGNSNSSLNRDAGKLFTRGKKSDSNQLASYSTDQVSYGNDTYATSNDYVGTKAITKSAKPKGMRQQGGYRSNARMSVDDVKKMLNPGDYAQLKGI